MIGWGVISAATALTNGPEVFYGLRFLLGIAEAGFFPGIFFTYLTDWYPSGRRARIVAWFMMAIAAAGSLVVPFRGGFCSPSLKSAEVGWQWLFLLEGLPSMVMGVAVLFYLDNGIGEAKWLIETRARNA